MWGCWTRTNKAGAKFLWFAISLIPNFERLYTSLAKVSSLMCPKNRSTYLYWSALRKSVWWVFSDSNRGLSVYETEALTAELKTLIGATDKTRTCDRLITNQLLYQLSYGGMMQALRTCLGNFFYCAGIYRIKKQGGYT